MPTFSRGKARKRIAQLGLPPIVRRLFDDEGVPDPLFHYLLAPDEFFRMDEHEREDYGFGDVTPLWMDQGGSMVVYDHEAEGFARFLLLDGSREPEEDEATLSWQQLLVKEFEMWVLSNELPENLEKLAELFGFEWLEEVREALEGEKLTAYEEHGTWYRGFLRRVGKGRKAQ